MGRSAPNVVALSRDYEAATGRLARQTHGLLGADVLDFDYQYTERGNIACVEEGGRTDAAQDRDRAYTYDALERLVEVVVPERPGERETYTLDPEGNHVASQRSDTHAKDAANRLTPDDRYGYTSDLCGNLSAKTAPPGATDANGTPMPDWTYEYDNLDQPIAVSRNGTLVERYRYDAFGRRSVIETANDNRREATDLARFIVALFTDRKISLLGHSHNTHYRNAWLRL